MEEVKEVEEVEEVEDVEKVEEVEEVEITLHNVFLAPSVCRIPLTCILTTQVQFSQTPP